MTLSEIISLAVAGILGIIYFDLRSYRAKNDDEHDKIKASIPMLPNCKEEQKKLKEAVKIEMQGELKAISERLATGSREFDRHTEDIKDLGKQLRTTNDNVIRLMTRLDQANGSKWDGRERRRG